jgi:hypothetical protein
MKRWILALGASVALSTLPVGAFAHGYDAGDAALGGLVGGLVGGLIGAGGVPVVAAPIAVAPAPLVVERYTPAPVIVERYAPRAVVVERPAPVVVYKAGHRRWHGHNKWHKHSGHRRHWDD